MSEIRVLADFHHQDLFYSFKLLFENRYGGKLFRPIGREWYDAGFWKYTSNNDPGVIDQYLGMPGVLYNWNHKKVGETEDYILIQELKNKYQHKCLTLEQFKRTPIDIVISSIPAHDEAYARLIAEHKPNAKLIRHEGNSHNWTINPLVKNLMISVKDVAQIPPSVERWIVMHQEFDTNMFNYQTPKNYNWISSFMNCARKWVDGPLWDQYKLLLPDFEWNMHGIDGDQGNIDTAQELADAFHDSAFLWHLKAGAVCGGHILFNALACGKPIISKGSYVYGEFAGKLIDGYNFIDLELRSPEENANFIRHCSQPGVYSVMSANTYNTFTQMVNFEQEVEDFKVFLEQLT